MNFQIGNKVRCISPPGTGQLNSNEDYTVTWTDQEFGLISVNKWPMMAWHESRFDLVVPTNKEVGQSVL